MEINVRVDIHDCSHCGREGESVFDRSLSYDLEHIWAEVDLPLDPNFTGHKVGDLQRDLERALSALMANEERFKKLVPDDAGSTWEGLIRFTKSLLAVAKDKPRAIVTMEIK